MLLFPLWLIERECTVESRFFEPPRETKTGSENRIVRETRGKMTAFDWGGKRLLVRVIGRFEKIRVREIGSPLYYSFVITSKRLGHRLTWITFSIVFPLLFWCPVPTLSLLFAWLRLLRIVLCIGTSRSCWWWIFSKESVQPITKGLRWFPVRTAQSQQDTLLTRQEAVCSILAIHLFQMTMKTYYNR